MNPKIPARVLVLALTLMSATGPLPAQARGSVSGDPEVAVGGYSPMSHFEVGRPEKGSALYTSTYKGKVYWFTSAEQVARFESDPEAYAPVFPDHCPYSLSLGRAVAIDPTYFLILGGNLLLFHDRDEMATVARTADGPDADAMLEKARSNLLRMGF